MNAQTAAANAADSSLILLREDVASVAILTLNRPHALNSLSEAMLEALSDALTAIAHDAAVRVVVLAANGPAFSAGHDLKELYQRRSDEDGGRAYFKHIMTICSTMMQQIVRLPQPVIAAVQATATAAGCQLVATCDLAIASRSAKFATSGINVGLFCSTPAVALSRNVLQKPALEMLLTGDFIDAQTARERGLVNRVVAPDSLDAEIEALTASIAAKSPDAIAAGKRLFYTQNELSIEAAYALAGDVMASNATMDDARRGIAHFTKRAH